METVIPILALFTLVGYVNTTSNRPVVQCPKDCYCQVASSGTQLQLYVDCGGRPPAVYEEQLTHELDSLLSADYFVENLTSLNITNTILTHVPASVCKLVNLTSLNLNDNKLSELPDNCFTKLTKLVKLSISRNAIIRLQDGIFDGLMSLVKLDLSYNHIYFIGLRVFSNSSDLTSLRSLSLEANRLTSLEPWWYYRCIVGNETSGVGISLKHNLISKFTNKLKFVFHCGMKRPYGHIDLSHNRIIHLMDIINGWNLGGKYIYTKFVCLINLYGSHPFMTMNLYGTTFDCDCTDFAIYRTLKLFPRDKVLQSIRCNNFYDQYEQPMNVLSIPLNQFVCNLSDRCPSDCQCVYRPENHTLHVYCSAANLSSLPYDLPPIPKRLVKYKLDFSNNKQLRHLEYRPYFANTSILDVSNCRLAEITVTVLKELSRFSVVNFRGNMLQSFPREAETVNISARLLIGNNPWRCSCDNSWMIGWFQSLSDQISDAGDINCRSPSRMYGRNVLKSTVEKFCVDPVKRAVKSYLIIVISLSVSVSTVVVLVIAGLLFYKFRVKFYKQWKFHPFDRDECVGEDMDYDVFLCCSSDDHNPHGLHILSEMESNGYRVCYHLRDFLAGAPITDNMIQSIERSKRTLCFVSNNFLRRLCITLLHVYTDICGLGFKIHCVKIKAKTAITEFFFWLHHKKLSYRRETARHLPMSF